MCSKVPIIGRAIMRATGCGMQFLFFQLFFSCGTWSETTVHVTFAEYTYLKSTIILMCWFSIMDKTMIE